MKPEQFIREQGLDAIKDCIEEAEAYGGLYVNAKTLELSEHIPSYDAVSITELMRLVESLDLAEMLGGIDALNGLLDMANSPFSLSGITRDGVFYSSEKIKELAQVHESIYGGGDE